MPSPRLGRSSPSTRDQRRMGWLSCLTAMVLVVAGCTREPVPETPDPWPTVWGLEEVHQNYPVAYRLIPTTVNGTSSNRVYVDDPEEEYDDEASHALYALERFLTVRYAVTHNSLTHVLAYLYQFVATDRMLHELYPNGPFQVEHSPWYEGPVWIWLLYIDPAGPERYRVGVCTDIGWWERSEHQDQLPRTDRALLEEFLVVQELDNAGTPRWKVDQEYKDATDRLASDWGQACRDWAVHDLEEQGW
jgi:hypothetical protein